jgi:hypothetical protein
LKNQKQIGQSCTLSDTREREKKTISNNPSTIRHHTPHHVKKDTMTHPKRQRKVKFGYLGHQMRCLNSADTTNLLVHA